MGGDVRCVPAAAAVQSVAAATAVLWLPNVKMAPGGQEYRFKENTHLKLIRWYLRSQLQQCEFQSVVKTLLMVSWDCRCCDVGAAVQLAKNSAPTPDRYGVSCS